MNDNVFKDSREMFNETFIYEMPMGTPPKNYDEDIKNYIRERQRAGAKTIKLSNNLYKIEGRDVLYYWYEENNNILLGVELSKERYGLRVNYIGKPNRKNPPYASDLYLAILNDRKGIANGLNNIIVSDSQLSDQGFGIWAKLLTNGHQILIYDTSNPGQSYKSVKSVDELNQYFRHNDKTYEKYRFVIIENNKEYAWETEAIFSLRRLREISNIL